MFQNEISPLAIPYHSSPIPMSMQSLKKTGQKVLKLEHRNEALTDKQTDGRTLKVWRVKHNTPPLHVWRGIIRFVSTGENCGKPCLVCKKKLPLYTFLCKDKTKGVKKCFCKYFIKCYKEFPCSALSSFDCTISQGTWRMAVQEIPCLVPMHERQFFCLCG